MAPLVKIVSMLLLEPVFSYSICSKYKCTHTNIKSVCKKLKRVLRVKVSQESLQTSLQMWALHLFLELTDPCRSEKHVILTITSDVFIPARFVLLQELEKSQRCKEVSET